MNRRQSQRQPPSHTSFSSAAFHHNTPRPTEDEGSFVTSQDCVEPDHYRMNDTRNVSQLRTYNADNLMNSAPSFQHTLTNPNGQVYDPSDFNQYYRALDKWDQADDILEMSYHLTESDWEVAEAALVDTFVPKRHYRHSAFSHSPEATDNNRNGHWTKSRSPRQAQQGSDDGHFNCYSYQNPDQHQSEDVNSGRRNRKQQNTYLNPYIHIPTNYQTNTDISAEMAMRDLTIENNHRANHHPHKLFQGNAHPEPHQDPGSAVVPTDAELHDSILSQLDSPWVGQCLFTGQNRETFKRVHRSFNSLTRNPNLKRIDATRGDLTRVKGKLNGEHGSLTPDQMKYWDSLTDKFCRSSEQIEALSYMYNTVLNTRIDPRAQQLPGTSIMSELEPNDEDEPIFKRTRTAIGQVMRTPPGTVRKLEVPIFTIDSIFDVITTMRPALRPIVEHAYEACKDLDDVNTKVRAREAVLDLLADPYYDEIKEHLEAEEEASVDKFMEQMRQSDQNAYLTWAEPGVRNFIGITGNKGQIRGGDAIKKEVERQILSAASSSLNPKLYQRSRYRYDSYWHAHPLGSR